MSKQKMKHIVLAAAGTSGHIRPAWTLAKQAEAMGMSVAWIGSVRDTWVPPEAWMRTELDMQGVRNHGIKRWLGLPWVMMRSMYKIYRMFLQARPDKVILMGGYVSVPTAIVAKLMRIPYVVFEQNTVMCLSNRCVLPGAAQAYTGLPLLKPDKRVRFVGNPLPANWLPKPKLAASKVRILIMGGSQGAHYINMRLPLLLKALGGAEIVHVAGNKHLESVEQLYKELGIEATCFGYKESLYDLLTWADFAVTRAGAMSITECLALCLPCIMIPFPAAADQHQMHNASWYSSQGGGYIVPEDEVFDEKMADALNAMKKPEVLSSMRERLKLVQRPFDEKIFWHSE